ncbi:MAG TPA: GMC family oxidoreductase [Porticoccus sp.]|nr:GMC family oxidoreductase [Porticoccus sp.]
MKTTSTTPDNEFDFDQVIIGSGFGGSCSALRLSEKGHRVLVLEKGKRWNDEDFPKTNWNIKKNLWAPFIGFKGLYQVNLSRKVIALHGAGVGGGSLIYGNVHFIPEDKVFNTPSWKTSKDNWKESLLPFYGLAQRMIGVSSSDYENDADHSLRKVAEKLGRGDSYRLVNTGILFRQANSNSSDGQEGADRGDPYFSGDGPDRNNCQNCGACMLGCPHNAKNTLVKNYLYFAERNGVEIRAESKATRIVPLPYGDGKAGDAGYEITVKDSSGFGFAKTYKLKTRGIVLSAGVFGTISLLLDQKYKGKTLPDISPLLGRQVRTNSETLIPVSTRKRDANGKAVEICHGPAISSIISADDETNIEIVRYAPGADAAFAGMITVPITDGGGNVPRVIRLLVNIVKNPIKALRTLNPFGAARNTVWLLVMQTKDSFIHMQLKRRWYKAFTLQWEATQEADDEPLTAYFPIAHKVAELFTKESGGDAANILGEIIADTPLTAHIMGGVSIGTDSDNGVIDDTGEVFGYKNLRVLDGTIIPGNLGVNPSLTILALTEHAMSKLPVFNQQRANTIKPVIFSKPLDALVSDLDGEGDLLAAIRESSPVAEKQIS